jgi:protein-S-isoprenylcysteine O-methyltransferase Ste14
MTTSASTPRLRLTLIWYLGLVAAAALTRPSALPAPTAVLLDALALLLVALAVLGRLWCSVFIAGRKDEQLVVEGPYSACRHPLYTLSLVGGTGLGLATHSPWLTAATLALLAALFSRAAVAEEAFLAARHGAAFERYAATTRRFWPRFAHYRAPERLAIQPRVLWKAFVDAGAFVLLYALVVAARQAQALQALPTLLDLR